MPSAWLNIPLEDYEAHMRAAHVGQLAILSQLFAAVLTEIKPRSVAILGLAGGNGLDHIDPTITQRTVGIDINPAYLEAVRQRHPFLPSLELHQTDLTQRDTHIAPVDLAHAALLFEHTGLNPCLHNTTSLVRPGGYFSAVLQLPAPNPAANLQAQPNSSIDQLREHFQLIPPDELIQQLASLNFTLLHETTTPVPSSKAFWSGLFQQTNTL